MTSGPKILFKCRKCRSMLLSYPNSKLVNAHGHEIQPSISDNSPKVEFIDLVMQDGKCSTLHQDVFYIDEVHAPEWITSCIDKGDWMRGKLICPHCSSRVGSFDFVSGFHCQCQSSVVPPIHLVKSKVDYNIDSISQSDLQ